MATNLGQYLIKLLEVYDVDLVFGIPGVHTAEMYRGLAGSPIRHVTPRHEQGAGFMADGYARATGKPGVCLVITGPGLSNIATAMLQARADSIPMLVIAGVNDASPRPLGRLHEMPDQFAFGGQVAAASWRITEPEHLPAALSEAYALFEGKRPGPVLIEIPLSAMGAGADHMPPPKRAGHVPAVLADKRKLTAAADLLTGARSPVLLVGGGARRAAPQILDLASRLQAPVFPTINARSLFAADDPLVVPVTASMAAVREFIDAADLVLAVGTELGPTDYDMGAFGEIISPQKLIRIDIDPAEASSAIPADIFLMGDAAPNVRALADLIPTAGERDTGGPSDVPSKVADLTATARAALPPAYRSHIRILERIRDTLPNAFFVGDSTQLVYAGNMAFAPGNRGGWFNSSVGYGTLGYALPAAIGAKLGRPDHPVVVLIGDGGLQFTLGELGGLRDESAPLIVLVWNNSGYGEIKSYMIDHGVEPDGVDLTPPDFGLLAQAYGIDFRRLKESELEGGLAPLLREGVLQKSGILIEVAVG